MFQILIREEMHSKENLREAATPERIITSKHLD